MAASSVIPARTDVRPDRGAIARTAARTAPRGPGLATVVALRLRDDRVEEDRAARGPIGLVSNQPARAPMVPDGTPTLRLVESPRRGGLRLGRQIIVALVAVLVVVMFLGVARGALAGPETLVAAGHVVLEPGETLWDVAVRSAPAGVDPRAQLDAIRRLNGFGSAALDAWTVVLIPAS